METESDLEAKYKKLALEYSKIRSQATVLKKAVLDEQQKTLQVKSVVQQQEQKIRKHEQEMESVTFRNDQLTKRIVVLQEELRNCRCDKKNRKHISNDHEVLVLRDEELYKRTEENAKLVSSIADKDLEIMAYREKMEMLEDKIKSLDRKVTDTEEKCKTEVKKLKNENVLIRQISQEINHKAESIKANEEEVVNKNKHWEQEAKRWQTECELLRSKPQKSDELTEYYESQLRELIEVKQLAQSESNSLWAENTALATRLEHAVLDKKQLEENTDKNLEELRTTCEHYKTQLDAMTEHLAAQNEKITKQSDDIQILKHKLNLKK